MAALRLNATYEHTIARYEDLASATARLDPNNPYGSSAAGAAPGQISGPTWASLYDTALPARTLMSVTAGTPLPFG